MDSCLHICSAENGFMPSQMFSREWIHAFTYVQQRMDSCLHRCSAENGFMPSHMFSREWIHAFTDVQQRMDSCLHRWFSRECYTKWGKWSIYQVSRWILCVPLHPSWRAKLKTQNRRATEHLTEVEGQHNMELLTDSLSVLLSLSTGHTDNITKNR